MNVWCHLSTIISQRRILQIAGILTLCVALITTLFFNVLTTHATPGVNQVISFQGRLLNSAKEVVPDGTYNIQFKIYEGGSGTLEDNPDGELKWFETYTNNNNHEGVKVTNGYMSVDLGSKTPFGSLVDWNNDTIWLSMNIAGLANGCTQFDTTPCDADGEMTPMKRLTATPYALNSAKLGGISADGFIKNSTDVQTANLNISGTAQANTIQGNTSVIAPLFDTDGYNTALNIGTTFTGSINIGTMNNDQEIYVGSGYGTKNIYIGTGDGQKTVRIGSTSYDSSVLLQGGMQGVRIESSAGFVVHDAVHDYDQFAIQYNGRIDFTVGYQNSLDVKGSNGSSIFLINDANRSINTSSTSVLIVNGDSVFNRGITIQGTTTYTSPDGTNLGTAINIPNSDLGNYATIMAFGLGAGSSSTARGILIADARTTAHQATIGVLSPDENNIMGISWNGSNTTAALTTTANSVSLQGNGLNILTATNNSGAANVGIGNNASSGYALDVTGDVNASSSYLLGGVAALTNSSLNFGSGSAASIASSTGVDVKINGSNIASFNSDQLKLGDATGQPTLLTLDSSATVPTATGSGVLGSMYYDTTLGKVQCYEASGWGDCGNVPDTFVSLVPEYSNTVTEGSALGTLSSGFCSDNLDINDSTHGQPVCGTDETQNFYRWTSSETTLEAMNLYVTYQLPSNFDNFIADSTTLLGRTDSSDAAVSLVSYKKSGNDLVACGTGDWISQNAQTEWQVGGPTGNALLEDCNFAAGDSVVFKISLEAKNNANAYLSNLNFAYKIK